MLENPQNLHESANLKDSEQTLKKPIVFLYTKNENEII